MAPDLLGSVVRRVGAGVGLDLVAFALILGTIGLEPLANHTKQVVFRWTHGLYFDSAGIRIA
jgi:hypothetical protein